MKKNFKAFTLSEVIITLTILGVIAALVIPNMYQRYNERVMVTKVKKVWTSLNDAISMTQIENGIINTWDIGEQQNTLAGSTKIYNKLKPYLKISKDCNTENEQCFASSYKKLNKTDLSDIPPNLSKKKVFVLNDGTVLTIWSAGNTKCRNANECGAIWFDINGKKGPNIYGVDLYSTNLYYNPEINTTYLFYKPSNPAKPNCSKNSNASYAGSDCLYWVLYKGNMDYLRHDISNEL